MNLDAFSPAFIAIVLIPALLSVAMSRVLLAWRMATVMSPTGMASHSASRQNSPLTTNDVPRIGRKAYAAKITKSPAALYLSSGYSREQAAPPRPIHSRGSPVSSMSPVPPARATASSPVESRMISSGVNIPPVNVLTPKVSSASTDFL